MKKIILLLLLILPVIIVAVSFAIAGGIGRVQMYVEITAVELNELKAEEFYNEGYIQSKKGYELEAEIGKTYELEKFFTVYPEKAKFGALNFESVNSRGQDRSAAAKVSYGKIHITENMRSSDLPEIKITVKQSDKEFFNVYVRIKPDDSRFDYFGYDYDLLEQAASADDAEWKKFCGVNTRNGVLTIDKAELLIEHPNGVMPDFISLLRDGLDIAPYNLLDYAFDGWVDFAKSLSFKSGDNDLLNLIASGSDGYGIGVFDAKVLGTGVLEIEITTDWRGKGLKTAVKLEIV